MEMEKLKKKLAAHVSRNTEDVFSGLICASGSAASSLHASSSCTFAHLTSHHQDRASPLTLLLKNKPADTQVICLSTMRRTPQGFIRKRGRKKIH